MKAKVRESPPEPPGWVYEPKWDGFRMLAWGGSEPRLESRNGKPMLRYFPELLPALDALPPGTVVDGEIVVVIDGVTKFDSLQLRIHPAASRVEMLSGEIPAELVAFDLLALEGEDLRHLPYSERRTKLEALVPSLGSQWHLTPVTDDLEEATRWFHDYEAAGCDGIICKQTDGAYLEGKRTWIKWKHRRDADCVVGGYRVHKDGDKIGSILLGLYTDDGDLHFIGHCSGFSDHDRVELLRQFEQIRSDASFGSTDGEPVRMPGAESRWSGGKNLSWIPVEPGVVVQISYDQLEGNRFRHATRFERWRPDKPAAECTMDQLVRPEGASFGEVVG
ncbi:MAG: ATP-dependent DNA ligase [Acidimicrobiia bacterium]|nr:ATP-dependent DNA ligase [Acidimicrobiia bacterium]NNC75765.1 ATP-dependent DNA ligase [Acidimicrobiia bacterium]